MFKEVLAVKNEIQKFEFHMTGHYFTVMMDFHLFPRCYSLNKKLLLTHSLEMHFCIVVLISLQLQYLLLITNCTLTLQNITTLFGPMITFFIFLL